MPEPAFPAEDLYIAYPEPGGSNGASASIYRHDSAGSYVLPPLPHPAYSPGKLVSPHTDSPSCKKLVSSEKQDFNPFMLVAQMSRMDRCLVVLLLQHPASHMLTSIEIIR